ncbi:MAG: GAF and ANTAR domain-containing protein [Pseudonocardia sediminis]
MGDRGGVVRALLAIARDGFADHELALRICRACVDGLDVDGAAISLLTAHPTRRTLASTDPTADLLEELQFTLNEGACVEAATTGAPVIVADVRESIEAQRWPVFAAEVAGRSDVRALFALPLQWGAVNLGVLDLYRLVPGILPPEQMREALSSADTAALMMLGHLTDPGDGDGRGWLDPAVGNRSEIHQATGMVLVQLGVDAPEALARMRGHAFVHGRLLIEVARDVIRRRLVFTEETR